MADEHHESGDGHGHGHGHGGAAGGGAGHEIDKMPNRRLFNLLFGLSALTLLACIGVVQLFNMQVAEIESERADQGSFQLNEYREEMKKMADSWGRVKVEDQILLPDGKTKVSTIDLYHMPLAQAKKRVLDDAKLLEAGRPPPGWSSNDPATKAGMAQAKPMQPGQPKIPPTADGGAPAKGGAPTDGKAPAEGKAPEGEGKTP